LASGIKSKQVDQYKNLRYQKIALTKSLLMKMMQPIYMLMWLCKINDATYIVDSARTDGYKKGAKPLIAISQLEDFKEASAPVKKTRRTKKLVTLSALKVSTFYIFLPRPEVHCL
jgi:hypothetical protein